MCHVIQAACELQVALVAGAGYTIVQVFAAVLFLATVDNGYGYYPGNSMVGFQVTILFARMIRTYRCQTRRQTTTVRQLKCGSLSKIVYDGVCRTLMSYGYLSVLSGDVSFCLRSTTIQQPPVHSVSLLLTLSTCVLTGSGFICVGCTAM